MMTSNKESPFLPSAVILSPLALLKVTLILKNKNILVSIKIIILVGTYMTK